MFIKTFLKKDKLFSAILFTLLLALVCAGVAHAVYLNNKISGDLMLDGAVIDFQISPDGQYTVFRADAHENDKYELFSVRTLGGERVLLPSNLPEDGDVNDFLITPDSQHVVYYGAGISYYGLFVVPIGGGTPVELDEASDDFFPTQIEITSDSANVLFVLMSTSLPRQSRLYRIPIDGSPREAISDEYEGIIKYTIAPSNQYVVYVQDPWPAPGIKQIYQSNLEGVKTLLDEADISTFEISPDSEYVIYMKLTGLGYELFSIPISGGSPERLNGILTTPGTNVDNFKITPDSAYVIYRSDERTLGMIDLYRVPIDSSTDPLILTPWGMVLDGNVLDFEISPDSLWVVYRADQLVNNRNDLFSVPINGGLYNRLNPSMVVGDVNLYTITPNSNGVVFIADGLIAGRNELFAVLIDDGSTIKHLNDPLPTEGDVLNFSISNNSQGVVYYADQEENDVFNLYAVPSTGGASVQLNPALVLGGDVIIISLIAITPDDQGVVYLADQEINNVKELFITYDFTPPTDIALSSSAVDENQPVDTVVGTFITSDPDIGDFHTYTLVPGDGDADNGSFNIAGDQLRTSEMFDFETKPSYSIQVKTTDQGGLSFEKFFTITVYDVSEDSSIFLPLVVR